MRRLAPLLTGLALVAAPAAARAAMVDAGSVRAATSSDPRRVSPEIPDDVAAG
jgi:hypothetical protein